MLDVNVESFSKKEYSLLTLLISIMIISLQYNNYILAYSPSFYRQYAGQSAKVPYLNSTSYTSDGSTLSATIWLPPNRLINDSPVYKGWRYGIELFLASDRIPSYNVYIQQKGNGTWMTNTVEYYPRGVHLISKPLEKEHTYQLPKNGSQYVNLSFDLETMGYPDEYHVSSYAQKNNGTLLDTTYPVFVPPTPDTQCALTCVRPTWPNPI
jgi:hypothetical protein